jgi:hypothetical protein
MRFVPGVRDGSVFRCRVRTELFCVGCIGPGPGIHGQTLHHNTRAEHRGSYGSAPTGGQQAMPRGDCRRRPLHGEEDWAHRI